ncbi:NIPSNAP family protein [Luteococcus japonicus]|uniref:NIPSNAP family protein n=1 Tax=Luteococcus japonicus TaxID=33984 RepID=UPI000F48CEC5|nr:NIPSNAP family protein [Luteococcus japonicus]
MTIRQLRIYTIPHSKREAFFDRWDSAARPLMERHGFRIVTTWIGQVDPTSATLPVRLAKALEFLQLHRRDPGRSGLFEFG